MIRICFGLYVAPVCTCFADVDPIISVSQRPALERLEGLSHCVEIFVIQSTLAFYDLFKVGHKSPCPNFKSQLTKIDEVH